MPYSPVLAGVLGCSEELAKTANELHQLPCHGRSPLGNGRSPAVRSQCLSQAIQLRFAHKLLAAQSRFFWVYHSVHLRASSGPLRGPSVCAHLCTRAAGGGNRPKARSRYLRRSRTFCFSLSTYRSRGVNWQSRRFSGSEEAVQSLGGLFGSLFREKVSSV